MPKNHQISVFDDTRSERSFAGGVRGNQKNESNFKLTYNNLSETVGKGSGPARLDSARHLQLKLSYHENK